MPSKHFRFLDLPVELADMACRSLSYYDLLALMCTSRACEAIAKPVLYSNPWIDTEDLLEDAEGVVARFFDVIRRDGSALASQMQTLHFAASWSDINSLLLELGQAPPTFNALCALDISLEPLHLLGLLPQIRDLPALESLTLSWACFGPIPAGPYPAVIDRVKSVSITLAGEHDEEEQFGGHHGTCPGFIAPGTLAAICQAFPNVTNLELRLYGLDLDFSAFDRSLAELPGMQHLRALSIKSNSAPSLWSRLARHLPPSIETFSVCMEDSTYRFDTEDDPIPAIPRMTSLSLPRLHVHSAVDIAEAIDRAAFPSLSSLRFITPIPEYFGAPSPDGEAALTRSLQQAGFSWMETSNRQQLWTRNRAAAAN